MEYLQFVYAVEKSIREKICETMSVEVHTVTKNNGNERVGVTISEAGYNLSPTIYLEEFYKNFNEEECIEDVAEQVLELYCEVKIEEQWDVEFLKHYEEVKSKIAYKVINIERNAKILQEVPYVPYLDLAIVCYVLLEVDTVGTATILITDAILKLWKVDKETVFEDAKVNTEKLLPSTFSTMASMMETMCRGLEFPEEGREILYVLTNKANNLGAACMLYQGVLKNIGDKLEENFYVIPSSIHEVLIIPESSRVCRPQLEEMIREVNETGVEPEEVLSDRAYYYVRSAERLIL